MKKRQEIEKNIANAEELLTNLKAQLIENSKQVDKYNKKLKNLKKLNPGDEVRLNSKCKKWHGEHAFENNKVGEVITNYANALGFMSDKLVEVGDYTLVYLEFRDNVGEGPGGKFKISFPKFNIPSRTIYFGVENLILKD